MEEKLPDLMMLFLLLIVLICGKAARIDVYGAFLSGAEQGLKTALKLLPGLAAMLLMTGLLRSSGILSMLIRLMQPILKWLRIPAEVSPVLLLRPVTGSGCIAALEQIYQICGPDSRAARVASVLMGSSETIFYTMTVYLGAAGVRKLPYVLPVSLFSYFVAILVCGLIV